MNDFRSASKDGWAESPSRPDKADTRARAGQSQVEHHMGVLDVLLYAAAEQGIGRSRQPYWRTAYGWG